jgi:glycine betaine/proline transport system ATP-binding protein
MQQRVGLARALALDPELLFFDEPFSALDPLIRRDMQDELLRLKAKLRCTIVFITHDFAEALKLGDHIAIMKDGVFDQIGTPTEIISHPATDYVKEFTKDIPRTKVLTAAAVAQSVVGTQENGRSVGTATRIEDLVPMLLESPEPISVVDEHGEVIGVIDRSTVAALLESGR